MTVDCWVADGEGEGAVDDDLVVVLVNYDPVVVLVDDSDESRDYWEDLIDVPDDPKELLDEEDPDIANWGAVSLCCEEVVWSLPWEVLAEVSVRTALAPVFDASELSPLLVGFLWITWLDCEDWLDWLDWLCWLIPLDYWL